MSDNEDNIFDNESDEEELVTTKITPKSGFNKKLNKVTINTDDGDDSDYEEGEVGDDSEIDDDDEPDEDAADDDDENDYAQDVSNPITPSDPPVPNMGNHSIPGENDQLVTSNEVYEDNEEDEEPDETYLQKFDTNIRENYVDEFHPETQVHNYEEIAAMVNVVRDKNNIVVDPLHRTIPILTKYERARVIGQRTKQLNSGARPYVSVPEDIIDGYLIAQLELEQKKIPFIVRRPLPGNSGSEYWRLSDLEVVAL